MRNLVFSAAIFLAGATAASAADLEVITQPDDARFSWTGIYVGGSIGKARAEDDFPQFPTPFGPLAEHFEADGRNYGFHAGYMHQFGNFVIGGEYEYLDLGIQYSGDLLGPIPLYLEDTHFLKLRGGIAYDRIQVFGFGGGAKSNLNTGDKDWTKLAGAGVDYALTNNFIIGAQYSYSWFNSFDGQDVTGNFDNMSIRATIKF